MKRSFQWVIPTSLEQAKKLWRSWTIRDQAPDDLGGSLYITTPAAGDASNIIETSHSARVSSPSNSERETEEHNNWNSKYGHLPRRRRCFSEKRLNERTFHNAGDYSQEIGQFWTERGLPVSPTEADLRQAGLDHLIKSRRPIRDDNAPAR